MVRAQHDEKIQFQGVCFLFSIRYLLIIGTLRLNAPNSGTFTTLENDQMEASAHFRYSLNRARYLAIPLLSSHLMVSLYFAGLRSGVLRPGMIAAEDEERYR